MTAGAAAAGLFFLCASLGAQASFYDLVAEGSAAQVLAALQQGADARESDRLGVTPLMAAAARNPDPAVMVILLAARGQVKERDSMGETPLSYAARSNSNPAVIRELVAAGAGVDERDSLGRTPG